MRFFVVFLVAAVPITITASFFIPDNGDDLGFPMLDGTLAALDQSPSTTGDGHVIIGSQVNPLTSEEYRLALDEANPPASVGWDDLIPFNAKLLLSPPPTFGNSNPSANNEQGSLATNGELYAEKEIQQLVQDGVKQYFTRFVSGCVDMPCFPDRGNNPGLEQDYGCCKFTYEQPDTEYEMGLGGCNNWDKTCPRNKVYWCKEMNGSSLSIGYYKCKPGCPLKPWKDGESEAESEYCQQPGVPSDNGRNLGIPPTQ